MSEYANLERRMAEREVILLDGAIGSQLQTMGVPMSGFAWAAGCVAAGVQIVGGCCGIEIEHIRPLRDALPTHLP